MPGCFFLPEIRVYTRHLPPSRHPTTPDLSPSLLTMGCSSSVFGFHGVLCLPRRPVDENVNRGVSVSGEKYPERAAKLSVRILWQLDKSCGTLSAPVRPQTSALSLLAMECSSSVFGFQGV